MTDTGRALPTLGWVPIGGGDEQCSWCGATWRPSHNKPKTHVWNCGIPYKERAEAAEHEVRSLREELNRRVEATAEARKFQVERLIVRYVNIDGDAEWQADIENELAAAELRGLSTLSDALVKIEQEMRKETATPKGYLAGVVVLKIDEWADRLAALTRRTPQQQDEK